MKGCLAPAILFSVFVAGCLAINIIFDSPSDVYESRSHEMSELERLQEDEYTDDRRMEAIEESRPGAIPCEDARDHIGEDVTLYGVVAEVDQPGTEGDPIFVDLGAAYPDKSRTTGVIWSEYHSVFPDIFGYEGCIVFMRGTMYENDGVPNIKLTDASQIERAD